MLDLNGSASCSRNLRTMTIGASPARMITPRGNFARPRCVERGALLTGERNMDELTEALAIANKVLDEPYCDPDDDLRVVARQLGRLYERFNQTVGESNRYRTALLELYPGLVLDRRYADADDDIDALN